MAKMVMHRALFTWFILLVFFILLCLRLERRTFWNWFLIFVPMWIYDLILLIDAVFNLFICCKHDRFRTMLSIRNIVLLTVVVLIIIGQIMICLKLQYPGLGLSLVHVLVPFWVLLPILIVDISAKLILQR